MRNVVYAVQASLELKRHVFHKEGSMINELGQSVRASSISFACISISLFHPRRASLRARSVHDLSGSIEFLLHVY